jgi:hypothetical protein
MFNAYQLVIDNAFLRCSDPEALQPRADSLTPDLLMACARIVCFLPEQLNTAARIPWRFCEGIKNSPVSIWWRS